MSQVTNTVRFVLDGKVVEAQGARRTTTVLDYLREQLHRTGTKEGCAEGDCGACVVMVGSLNASGQGVDYVPVNSCIQLLPTLDGKSVKTVESLKKPDGTLHPVQQAMVNCHGSQCGFCTPGIVMSLVNLVQVNQSPKRQDVSDALSGNLCRCTGYAPILDAASKACSNKSALKLDDAADVPLLKEIQRSSTPTLSLEGDIIVQPVVRTRKGNEFVSPATLAEVADYLVKHPTSTLLAGSTEVGLQVNKQYSRPDHIVYLGNVTELKQVKDTPQAWHIGAVVSLTEVETLVSKAYPDFAEVLRRFGSPPIRSTATLAGNIANGSPIGDTMPCLMALGATLTLRRSDKTRTVSLDKFYTGLKQTVLQAGEFIEAVVLPKPQAGQVFRAHKVSKPRVPPSHTP
jgi:xanthine dehydrogenase small subunit